MEGGNKTKGKEGQDKEVEEEESEKQENGRALFYSSTMIPGEGEREEPTQQQQQQQQQQQGLLSLPRSPKDEGGQAEGEREGQQQLVTRGSELSSSSFASSPVSPSSFTTTTTSPLCILRKESSYLDAPPSLHASSNSSSNTSSSGSSKRSIRFADAIGQSLAAVNYSQRLQYSPASMTQHWLEDGEGWRENEDEVEDEVEDEDEDYGEGWEACQGNVRRKEGGKKGGNALVGGRGEWWLMWPTENTAAQKAMERRRKMKRERLRRKEKAQREQRQKEEKELEEKKEDGKKRLQEDREKGNSSRAVKFSMYTRAKLPAAAVAVVVAAAAAAAVAASTTTKGVCTPAGLKAPTGAGTKGERGAEGGGREKMLTTGAMIASTATSTTAVVPGVAKRARDIGEIFLVGEEEAEMRKGCCVMS
jgi:hypothetical protein